MNKQPLKALVLIGAIIGGITFAVAQTPAPVIIDTTEVNDILKAGANKVSGTKSMKAAGANKA